MHCSNRPRLMSVFAPGGNSSEMIVFRDVALTHSLPRKHLSLRCGAVCCATGSNLFIYLFLGTHDMCARSINPAFVQQMTLYLILLSGQAWTLQAGLVLSGWEGLQLLPQSGGQGEHGLLHGNSWMMIFFIFFFHVLIRFPLGPSCLWGSCRCARP